MDLRLHQQLTDDHSPLREGAERTLGLLLSFITRNDDEAHRG
ncbi:hypothetical protein [Mycobacterium sp.]|nr:hypothetical protein [Mycobacterium sp.]